MSRLRVTAVVCWWNEPVDLLAACVIGCANIADRIVAVDGSYRRYPDATVTSPAEQAEVIRDTALAMGMDALVVIPGRLWAGQVEKRSFAYAEAAKGSDFIAIVDADWIIHADRDAARAELERTTGDVVWVPFYTPPAGETFATGWHRREAGRHTEQPHLFRALPGIKVERIHYQVSAIKNGKPVWMRHAPTTDRAVLPKTRLKADYLIEHRSLYRDELRIMRGRAFCNDRVKVMRWTGQEDDQPDLPRPIFDYVTIPYER